MQLKESLYTASNMRNDPRWKHGDLTRISTLCNQRGVKGNFIECAIRGLQVNSSNARKHFDTVRAIANEYLAAREAGSPIEVLTPREELKQLRSTATPAVVQKPTTAPAPKQLTGTRLAEARRLLSLTQKQAAQHGGVSQRDVSELESDTKVFIPSTYLAFLGLNGILLNAIFNSELDLSLSAVVQNATTAPGTGSTLSTRTLDANLRDDIAELMARNAALLVEVEELKRELADRELRLDGWVKDHKHLQGVNSRNAERIYEAEDKAEELEADNTRLRRALAQQAATHAATLNALLPQA